MPTEAGVPATAGEGRYHVSTKKSYKWRDVEPGTHTFAVQLVNVDHTPLEPPITSETTVTLASGDEVTEMERR